MIPEIPERYIEAYQNVKAPTELHDRVISSARTAKRRVWSLPKMLAAAASLLIIFVPVFVLLGTGRHANIYITYSGDVVDSAVDVMTAEPRTMSLLNAIDTAPCGIPLEVHAGSPVELTVTAGVITVVDKDGKTTSSGSSATLTGDATVYWYVDTYETATASLTLEGNNNSAAYLLTANDGKITIEKEKN